MDGPQDGNYGDHIRRQVEKCLECLQPSAAEQREALERALQLTAEASGTRDPNGDASSDAGGSQQAGAAVERRRWLRVGRLRVLQHLERLDTVLELNNGWALAGRSRHFGHFPPCAASKHSVHLWLCCTCVWRILCISSRCCLPDCLQGLVSSCV